MTKSTTIIFTLYAFLLTSCGEKTLTLEEKKAELQKLKKEYATLKGKIDNLETDIIKEEKPDAKSKLKPVEAITLKDTIFKHFVEVQGNVESDENVLINPEIPGIVLRKLVKEGERVTKGQTIIELDAESVRKSINEVEVSLELAEVVFQKQQNLWNQKIGTEIQYLQAKNNKERLEKSLASLKTQLSKAFVKSPINGVVDEIKINVGEMANPAMPLARVINLSNVTIDAEVSETYTRDVKKGDTVIVNFPTLQKEINTPVTLVGQYIKSENRTFKIQMRTANTEGLLKPNTLAVVKINDFTKTKAITAPNHLIQKSTNGTKFVYVVRKESNKDIVRKVVVETGKTYQGATLVLSGLQAGDVLIDKGYSEVVDGEEVNLLKVL